MALIEIDGLPSYKMGGFSMANCYITRWYHLTSGKRLPFANWKITIVEWVNQLYIFYGHVQVRKLCMFLPGRVRCLDIELSRQLGIPTEVSGWEIIYTGGFFTAILPIEHQRILIEMNSTP